MGYFGFTASTGGATGTGPEIYVGSLVVGPPVPEPATGLLIGIVGIASLPRRPRSKTVRASSSENG
jgi:hypothetical protein